MTEQRPPQPKPNPRPVTPPSPKVQPPMEDAPENGAPPKGNGAMIGWVVSGLLVVGVVVALLFATGIFKSNKDGNPFGDATTDTTSPGALEVLAASVNIGDVTKPAPPALTSGTGAEMTYRELVKATYPLTLSYKPGDVVTDNRLMSAYEKLNAAGKTWDPAFDPIVDLLVKGADQGYNESYDLVFPDCPISFKNENAFADLIRGWSKLLEYKALDADAEKKFDEGEKYLRAMLIFGDRLWKYGLYVGPRGMGLTIVNQALAGLEQHYTKAGDAAKASAAKLARVPISETLKKWRPKFDAIFSAMQFQAIGRKKAEEGAEKAADIWNVAQNDKDRSWRLSAIMWFGYLKAAKGVSEQKVNDYLASRAEKERKAKGDITLADRAEEAKNFKMEEVNEMIRPMSWAQN
jgi:hypothetical protein